VDFNCPEYILVVIYLGGIVVGVIALGVLFLIRDKGKDEDE